MTRTRRWHRWPVLNLLVFGAFVMTFVDRPHMPIWSAVTVAIFGLQLYVDAKPEQRQAFVERYELWPVNRLELATGLLVGAAMITAVVGYLRAKGWYHFVGLDLSPSALASFVVLVAVFLVVALAEELLLRGMLFGWLERRAGSWVAILGSSLIFAAGHGPNPHASLIAIAGLVVAGFTFASVFAWRRNLWMVIGIHWAWNLFEGPVWGTPVSGLHTHPLVRAVVKGPASWTGGRFGPEAGWAVVIVSAAIGVAALAAAIGSGRFPVRRTASAPIDQEPAILS